MLRALRVIPSKREGTVIPPTQPAPGLAAGTRQGLSKLEGRDGSPTVTHAADLHLRHGPGTHRQGRRHTTHEATSDEGRTGVRRPVRVRAADESQRGRGLPGLAFNNPYLQKEFTVDKRKTLCTTLVGPTLTITD